MSNMEHWNAMKRPPESALKTIKGGRLSGMTDISPMWRIQIMTEIFGVCGIGWKYEIVEHWSEEVDKEICTYVIVNVYIKDGDEWSSPIPGVGGSKTLAQELKGSHVSDEAYKMSLTDSLSVAFKSLGCAADIYMGKYNGSKYQKEESNEQPKPVTAEETNEMENLIIATSSNLEKFLKFYGIETLGEINRKTYDKAMIALKAKKQGGQK